MELDYFNLQEILGISIALPIASERGMYCTYLAKRCDGDGVMIDVVLDNDNKSAATISRE